MNWERAAPWAIELQIWRLRYGGVVWWLRREVDGELLVNEEKDEMAQSPREIRDGSEKGDCKIIECRQNEM